MSNAPTEIVASIFFDSWLEESPELRAEGSADDRHLIYEGQGVILDLLIRQLPDSASSHIGGQVLLASSDMENFHEVANLAVSMERGDSPISTSTNATGEFTFKRVPEGIWNLTVTLSERRFVVRGLSNQELPGWRSASDKDIGGNR
jgi:hypothetical protein